MYNTLNTPDSPVRETEINRVMQHLLKVVGSLEEMQNRVSARLTGITSGGGLCEDVSLKEISEFSAPLAKELMAVVGRMKKVNDDFDGLMNRIEL